MNKINEENLHAISAGCYTIINESTECFITPGRGVYEIIRKIHCDVVRCFGDINLA